MAEKSLDLLVAVQRAQDVIKKFKAKEIGVIQFAQEVAKIIEEYANEVNAEIADGVVSGKDKKAIAVSIINSAIDIPLIPEGVEAYLIGLLVDWVVDLLNKTGVFNK